MKTVSRLRQGLLFSTLAVTIAAAGWVGGKEQTLPLLQPSDAAAPRRAAIAAERNRDTDVPDPGMLGKRVVARASGDMFPGRSWQPSPAADRQSQPEPQAPPLPFTFLGRMVEDGRIAIFLSLQNETYVALAGDTVAGSYRVEEIGRAEVIFNYLPLNRRQILDIGAIN